MKKLLIGLILVLVIGGCSESEQSQEIPMEEIDKADMLEMKMLDIFASLNIRLTQLECPHEETELEEAFYIKDMKGSQHYVLKCSECGKILKHLTKKEYLEEKKKRLQAEVDEVQNELDSIITIQFYPSYERDDWAEDPEEPLISPFIRSSDINP